MDLLIVLGIMFGGLCLMAAIVSDLSAPLNHVKHGAEGVGAGNPVNVQPFKKAYDGAVFSTIDIQDAGMGHYRKEPLRVHPRSKGKYVEI